MVLLPQHRRFRGRSAARGGKLGGTNRPVGSRAVAADGGDELDGLRDAREAGQDLDRAFSSG